MACSEGMVETLSERVVMFREVGMFAFAYVSTAVIFDPKSALSFAATSVQSAFHFKFTYSRLVRDFIKSMSLFRMALVSNQSGSLFYDYFTT